MMEAYASTFKLSPIRVSDWLIDDGLDPSGHLLFAFVKDVRGRTAMDVIRRPKARPRRRMMKLTEDGVVAPESRNTEAQSF